MPSQFPAFRHTVEQQMADYQERIAAQIRREAAKRGESARDLAYALDIDPSTPERWFRGERTPQRRLRTRLAAHWELPLDEFEFDLEIEDQEVRDQLDRIEEKLDWITKRLKPAEGEDGRADDPAPRPGPKPPTTPPDRSAPETDEEEKQRPA